MAKKRPRVRRCRICLCHVTWSTRERATGQMIYTHLRRDNGVFDADLPHKDYMFKRDTYLGTQE